MALPKHARNKHQWDGGQCDFHPLYMCTRSTCHRPADVQRKKYETRVRLMSKFHALVYEIVSQKS